MSSDEQTVSTDGESDEVIEESLALDSAYATLLSPAEAVAVLRAAITAARGERERRDVLRSGLLPLQDRPLPLVLPAPMRGRVDGGVSALEHSPDGRILALGAFDGTTRLYDVRTGARLHTLRRHTQHVVAIAGVIGIHAFLDMALLAVPKLGRPVLEIDTTVVAEGLRVAAIGYPAKDAQRNPIFTSAVFGNAFGVKRAALGEVLDGVHAPSVFHDCSTLGGNSGSPLFSLATARVVGIHRSGFFMYRNEAVDGASLGGFAQPGGPSP